ncbi:hypothetical protein PIB30_006951 [Stylosanthes scabra]|uniref:Retrotransposon gag domain-containing protein n=1 Tax=Stylosanthes scabra TaxID=79078 RepID=A0ABU6Y369_9FABA|nr:hypothetical protein [Stylosanthes scabra]
MNTSGTFEHRMVCEREIDEVKCRAFPVTLTGLASKWFTLLIGSISTFVKKCKTIDGHTNSVASLCLTNGLNDFRKQVTTKPMWSRKEIHVIAKEFIYHEEVSRVVTTTKNPHTHTAPRVNAKSHNPKDNQRDSGFKGQPKLLKQKFKKNVLPRAKIQEADLCFVITPKDTDTKHKTIMILRMLLNKQLEMDRKSFGNLKVQIGRDPRSRKLGIPKPKR